MELHGILTAMVTPFDDAGRVDEAAARSLAVHLLDNGSHGLVIAGTTGESPTLADEEQIALFRAVRDEVGSDATLICGTGTNDTHHSAELTKAAVDAGADAVLAVTPYYNKPNEAGLRGHFAAIAEAAGSTSVVLYNIPSRSVVNMPPALLGELAQIENVSAVKQANGEEIQAIDGLDLLAGNDDDFLATLEAGGTGGITVASNVVGPRMRALFDAFQDGNADEARQIDAELRPVYEAMAIDTNPIPVKAACEMAGLIPSARMRLPMVEADEEQRAAIRAVLETQGLLATAQST
jgi:4-hydroxy-tetrahydrodipicolinate synthase